MKRALVTGAAGFIGQRLVRRLLGEGIPVRAFVRSASSQETLPADAEPFVGDIREPEEVARAAQDCDTVFHLAARAHDVSTRAGDEREDREVNVGGTRNVLDAIAASRGERLVFFSSVKAVGENTDSPTDEEATPAPESPYGRSKREAEELVLDASLRTGLHATCLRLPMVYGPGSKGNLMRMIRAIDRGLFPPLPALGNRRSMVHVESVVDAALLAAQKPAARGQCYFVTDVSLSTRELYESLCHALDRPVPRWHVPRTGLTLLARVGDVLGRMRGRRFPFDSDALEKLVGSAQYSSAKIERDLGFRPQVSFEAALAEIVAAYRAGQG
jgi:UDP-glucose 4-epimerase